MFFLREDIYSEVERLGLYSEVERLGQSLGGRWVAHIMESVVLKAPLLLEYVSGEGWLRFFSE